MSDEIKRAGFLYPFYLQSTQVTDTLARLSAIIPCARICLCTEQTFKPYLTDYNAGTGFRLQLQSQIGTSVIQLTVTPDGRVHSTDSRLITQNSFFQLKGSAQSVSVSEQKIPLLNQIIVYIPAGLRITCFWSQVDTVAKETMYSEQQNRLQLRGSLTVIDGYNTKCNAAQDTLTIAGGLGLGQGNVPVAMVKELFQQSYVTQPTTATAEPDGILSINGQSKNISILTKGSLLLEQDTQNTRLAITLKQGTGDSRQ